MASKKFIVPVHLVLVLIYFCSRHFDGVETKPTEGDSGVNHTLHSYFDQLEKAEDCTLPYSEWRHPEGASVLEPCSVMTGKRSDYNETDELFTYDLCEVVLKTLVNACDDYKKKSEEEKDRFNQTAFDNTWSIVKEKDICSLMSSLDEYEIALSPVVENETHCRELCGESALKLKPLCEVAATAVCQKLEKMVGLCVDPLQEDKITESVGKGGTSTEDVDNGGKNANDDDKGGKNTKDEDKGGKNTNNDDKGGKNTNNDDKGGKNTKDEDKGGKNTKDEDKGGKNTNNDDKGGKNTKDEDKGGENTNNDDKGGKNTKHDDKGGKDTKGDGKEGIDTKGDDKGGKDTKGDGKEGKDTRGDDKEDKDKIGDVFENSSSQVSNLAPYLIGFFIFSVVGVILYHQRDTVKGCFSKGQQSAKDIMKKSKEAKYTKLKNED